MLRKTVIALAAATTMALAVGGGTSPAEARHRHGHFGIYIGAPIIRHHNRYHCHYKRVKVWNRHHTRRIWVTVKTYCHRAWH